MAQKKTTATNRNKCPIESYEHRDKECVNNPPVGLVTPETDPDAGQRKTSANDFHLDSQLVWAGKAEHTSFEVPTISLHVHERIDPKTIIEPMRKRNNNGQPVKGSLFNAERQEPLREVTDFYRHKHSWTNRLITGDSLLVMNSLLEKKGPGARREGRQWVGSSGGGPMSLTVKSKRRVTDYGEVLTPAHIVNAMLDLVKQETERIDSRFLEPACGTGNFLIEILNRKLRVVEARYAKNQLEYERYAVLAISSIYGIDILKDNVEECRQRLFEVFDKAYTRLFKGKTKEQCRQAVRYILKKNIVHGNALTLKTEGQNQQPIIFPEWSLVNGSMLKRRDFAFQELLRSTDETGPSLCEMKQSFRSDTGETVFIPEPVKDYPPIHFLEVAHAYDELQP
jgi:SAM-dependent methyltransferase